MTIVVRVSVITFKISAQRIHITVIFFEESFLVYKFFFVQNQTCFHSKAVYEFEVTESANPLF